MHRHHEARQGSVICFSCGCSNFCSFQQSENIFWSKERKQNSFDNRGLASNTDDLPHVEKGAHGQPLVSRAFDHQIPHLGASLCLSCIFGKKFVNDI